MGLTVPSWSSVGDDKNLLSIPQTSKKKKHPLLTPWLTRRFPKDSELRTVGVI